MNSEQRCNIWIVSIIVTAVLVVIAATFTYMVVSHRNPLWVQKNMYVTCTRLEGVAHAECLKIAITDR